MLFIASLGQFNYPYFLILEGRCNWLYGFRKLHVVERGRKQILSNTSCRGACCFCSGWSTCSTLVKRHIRLKLTQQIPQGTEETKSRKVLFTMLLNISKQIQKKMLQFPRACTTFLRHSKLPSQPHEYVATKICLRLDQPSLVNN